MFLIYKAETGEIIGSFSSAQVSTTTGMLNYQGYSILEFSCIEAEVNTIAGKQVDLVTQTVVDIPPPPGD